MRILITGGAGFVGSNVAMRLKAAHPDYHISVADNLVRRGSEINLPDLKKHGINFFHCDIRLESDIRELPIADIVIDASADPSVLAGITSPTTRLIQSNFNGTIHLLEWITSIKAKLIFLSTSRVYSIAHLNQIDLEENSTRFLVNEKQSLRGISEEGISETFPTNGSRSFYGTAKLASELFIEEYEALKDLEATVFRCGVIAGPGQFGKVDQGILVHWLASHFWKQKLAYIGFGGKGKQVRDMLHIDDLYRLVDLQIHQFKKLSGKVWNVGGGKNNSVSLLELTHLCQAATGNKIDLDSISETRAADIPYYITDNRAITATTNWLPQKGIQNLLADTFLWLKENEKSLKNILIS